MSVLTDEQKALIQTVEDALEDAIDALPRLNNGTDAGVRTVLESMRGQLELIAVERTQ